MSSPGDPTVRMPSVGGATSPPPPHPPAGVPPARDGRWWWIAVGFVVLLAVLVAVVVITNGDDDPDPIAASTTNLGTPETSAASAISITASTTTTETTVVATTTAAPAPTPTTTAAPTVRILSFTGPPSVACSAPTTVELTWSTENAQGTALSVDGTAIGSFGPAETQAVPFACDGNPHSYVLVAFSTEANPAIELLSITQASG